MKNGKELDPIAAALAEAERAITAADVPFGAMLMGYLRDFVAKHPRGAEREMCVVIRERAELGIAALTRLGRHTLAAVAADLFHVRVDDAEAASAPALPRDQIEQNLPALRRNGWGSRLVADLDFLAGSYCKELIESGHQCDRLLQGEVITAITPRNVTVAIPGQPPRVIDRIKLVRDHRDMTTRLYQHEQIVIEPLRKLIEATEARLASGDESPIGRGIVSDPRE